jgi:hypothetical protein
MSVTSLKTIQYQYLNIEQLLSPSRAAKEGLIK